MARGTGMSRAWSLIEVLLVAGVVALIAVLTYPALRQARGKALEARCVANLRGVGQLIHSYAQAHEDRLAPAVRERDYYWNRGEQLGWDIQTGRWAHAIGGPGSTWRCPAGRTAYMANARATGLDSSRVNPDWPIYYVRTGQWVEPERLVVVYDAQTNMVEYPYGYPQAAEPWIGDLSDEQFIGWPRNEREVTMRFWMDRFGPHIGERYGVLFGDGHVRADLFTDRRAVLWSGPRWWP